MPYIGRDLNRGNYLKLDDISSSFNGSTQTFNLTVGGSAFTPGSAFSILVSLGGVIQEPESAYQVNNSEITFANAPTAQDSFFCIALGVALGIGVPGNGTVNGTQIAKPFNYDGFFYLNDASNRVGINSSIPSEALDIIGNTKISGIVTATEFSGQLSNASGISTFYDLRVTNNLTVEGTTTTLDTNLTGVDRVEINANSNSNAAIVGIQSGSAEIVKLLDGTDEVLKVNDGGIIDIESYIRHIDATGTSIGFPETGSQIIATTNGSRKFTLDGDGRILVGIATATFLASQGGSDLLIEKAVGAGGTVSIDIYSKNATGNSFVRFYNGSQSGKIGLVGIGHSLTFCTAGVNSERMRLTNVGLGVKNNNPKSALTVGTGLANSEVGGILVQNVLYSSNQDKPYLIAASQNWTGADTNWGTYGFQHRLKVDSGGSPRVTIDNQNGEIICFHSNKRVGIGTDNPLSLLHVHGEGGNGSGLLIRNAYDVVRQFFSTNSNDSSFLITYDGTGGAEITLHADGDLGLNESNGDDVFIGRNASIGDAKFTIAKANAGLGTAIALHNPSGAGSKIISSRSLVLAADYDNNSGISESHIAFETDGTEKVRIESGGRVIIGHDTASGDLHGPQTTTSRNPFIQLHGANTSSAGAALISWKNSAGAYYAPSLYLAHSGSDTIGTNGILPANGEFGSIIFSGDDGTDFVKGAMIKARLDGNVGINSMPGRLQFYTTPTGSETPVERFRIANDGKVIVYNAELTLNSTGNYTTHLNYEDNGSHFISMANGGATYFRGSSNNITAMAISGTGPVDIDGDLRHLGDTDTMLQFGTNTISLKTAANERVNISSTGLTTLKNFSGTGLRLEGAGSSYSGMQLQTTDSSTSVTRNIFIDTVNETGAAVANQVGSVQADGGSMWSWSTQPPGDRTDRRAERLRITANGTLAYNYDTAVSTIAGVDIRSNSGVHIRGADANTNNTNIYISGAATNQRKCAIIFDPVGGYCRGDLHFCMDNTGDLSDVTVSDTKMVMKADGSMGINTTAPVEKLGISGNIRLVNPTGSVSRIQALPSGTYSLNTSGGSAIAFHRFADAGGGSDEIAFETHHQGVAHVERVRINKQGVLLVGTQTASGTAPSIQIGSHTFNGSHYAYATSRVGFQMNGGLKALSLCSTYNDATHPEYGVVFVQGPSTSSYNVWSISPDGPAKGNDLNLHYGAQASNIHTSNYKKFAFTGAGQFLAPYTPSFCAKGITSHTGTTSPIDYTQEIFDVGDNYDPTAGTSSFTAPVTGKYFFHATAMIDHYTTMTNYNYLFLDFVYDGNSQGRERMMPRPSGGSFASIENSGIFHMVAGKTMQVKIVQSGGTNVTIRNDYRFFEGYFIG